MTDGGGVEELRAIAQRRLAEAPPEPVVHRRGIAPPGHTALQRALEREEIEAALRGQGPAEAVADILIILGALEYRLRGDVGTQERAMFAGIEQRLGVALRQLREDAVA